MSRRVPGGRSCSFRLPPSRRSIGLVATARAVRAAAALATMQSDFVSTVTHELKTPLASIRLISDTLAKGRYSTVGHHRRLRPPAVGRIGAAARPGGQPADVRARQQCEDRRTPTRRSILRSRRGRARARTGAARRPRVHGRSGRAARPAAGADRSRRRSCRCWPTWWTTASSTRSQARRCGLPAARRPGPSGIGGCRHRHRHPARGARSRVR